MSFLVDANWVDAPEATFVLVPGGTTHGFENRGEVRAGVLNFSVPGEFEPQMPSIVEWSGKNPTGYAGG